MILKLDCASESPTGLTEQSLLGPVPRVSDSVSGVEAWVVEQVPADVAGSETIL